MNSLHMTAYGQHSAVSSPVNRMMATFASEFRDNQDINLGVGYVNEDAIPRQFIKKALDAILADPERYQRAFNYGSPQGSANLIASLRSFLLARTECGLTEKIMRSRQIIIGANGATSLLESIAQLLPLGVVVTADPLYYIYSDFLERIGFTIAPVPEDEEGIRVDAIERAIDHNLDQLSFFYIVGVSNPTCTILSNSRRRALVRLVTDISRRIGRPVPLFLDGAYDMLIHNRSIPAPQSALPWDTAGLVYELGSMSKILAPALRVGYLIAAPSPFTSALVQRISDIGFSAPLMNQEICSYLLDHHIEQQIRCVNDEYREKAVRVREWLEAYLGDEIESISGGDAGFYYYITLKDTITDEGSSFFRFLSRSTGDPRIDGPAGDLHPRVAYVPGSHCVSSRGEFAETGQRQLRISYGYEDLDAIEQAIECLADAVAYARGQ